MSCRTVVIINDYASVNGGAAKVAIESACGLSRSGWKVHFFAAVGPVESKLIESGVTVTLTNQTDITHQTLLQGVSVGIWNTHAARRLTSLLSALPLQTTVIHLHGWIKALTGSVVRVSLDSGHPVTMTLHDYFLSCPNGGLYNFQKESQCELSPMSPRCIATSCDKRGMHHKLWRVGRQIRNQNAGIPSGMRHFIAVSLYSRKLLEPQLPAHAEIVHIPNPINVIKQAPASPSASAHLVCIGRLDPEKGVVMLARSSKESGNEIRFVGSGPEEGNIRKVNPDAVMLGWKSSEEVHQELRNARALVLPSLWHETQGMVVAEAASHGIPSLVPDKCAASEMVTHGRNGLVFMSGNSESLQGAIRELRDGDLVKQMGENAYAVFWETPPTLAAHVAQLDEYYQSLLRRFDKSSAATISHKENVTQSVG